MSLRTTLGRTAVVGIVLMLAAAAGPAVAAVPGVGLTLNAPATFLPGQTVQFTGRLSIVATVGIPLQAVDLLVDGVVVDSVTTAADGTYTAEATLAYPPTSHQVRAVAYAGTALETVSPTRTVAVARNTLSVNRTGAGSGFVVSNPAGISCPSDCSENIPHGDSVTLTATASAGSFFGGWSGDCTGSVPTCSLTMDSAKSVTASFTPLAVIRFSAGSSSGAESASPADLTVTRTGDTSLTSTVVYTTVSGSAVAGSDYTAASATLQFNPGETSKPVSIAVVNDPLDENDETFTVTLSNATNATLGSPSTHARTILDDDPLPQVGFEAGASSGGETATPAVLTVTLSPASGRSVTVDYATADVSAAAGPDYTAGSGTITFLPGETSKTISLNVNDDALDENDETFTVTLSNPQFATILIGTHTRTIVDDDALPTLAFTSASSSGPEPTSPAQFQVTLSPVSGRSVTVQYATVNGSASAPGDFDAATATLTFAPGETSKTIDVTILNDTLDEALESFAVSLSNPSNATLGSSSHQRDIVDDDPSPTVSFDATASSGSEGSTPAVIDVSLSQASGQTVTVDYATISGFPIGTATPGADFTPATGTLVFLPGETFKTISVPILEDSLDENDESFVVFLTNPVNAAIGSGTHNRTILDNDLPPVVQFTLGGSSATESVTPAVLEVTLSAPSGRTVTVQYSTGNQSASAGEDYAAQSGTLSFAPGETSKLVSVTINDDTLDEFDETFKVTLSLPTNASLGLNFEHVRSITDNDAPPTVQFSTATSSFAEHLSLSLTVTLSTASGKSVTVQYSTFDQSAVSGQDYVAAVSVNLVFSPYETSKVVPISVVNDTLDEDNETFVVSLANPLNATLGTPISHVHTIEDNDAEPTVSFTSLSSTGLESAPTAGLLVTLNTASGKLVTVQYATANGSAVAPADYTATSGTLSFSPGDTSETISVPIFNDTLDENQETFTVTLSNASNAGIGGIPTHTRGINDDDDPPVVGFSTGSSSGDESLTPAVIEVTLNTASGKSVTVNYATANGTAVAPGDYTTQSAVLTFAPGDTSETFSISVNNDSLDENNETFNVNLSSPSNADPGTMQHVRTILDNDPLPVVGFQIASSSAAEGAALTSHQINAIVTLSPASGRQVTVQFTTANETATANGDYVATSGVLTFNPGETSKSIFVTVNGDGTPEPNEWFSIHLSVPVNAVLGTSTHTHTIVNDD